MWWNLETYFNDVWIHDTESTKQKALTDRWRQGLWKPQWDSFFSLDFNGTKDSLCKTRGIKCSRYCHSPCLSAGGRSVRTDDSRLQSVSLFLFILHMHFKPTLAAETLSCGGIRVAFYLPLLTFPYFSLEKNCFIFSFFLLMSWNQFCFHLARGRILKLRQVSWSPCTRSCLCDVCHVQWSWNYELPYWELSLICILNAPEGEVNVWRNCNSLDWSEVSYLVYTWYSLS